MVFGTFDLLHKGHEHFLREAAGMGDELVVVVARDSTVRSVKRRNPVESESERRVKLEKTGIASRVLLGSAGDKYGVIRKERPDIICLGYDQVPFTGGLEKFLRDNGLRTDVVRLGAHRPDVFKTSIIRKSRKSKEAGDIVRGS
jgi:FAD synthetase